MGINFHFVDETLKNKIIEDRRMFHRYPELGWMEYWTSWIISERLKKLGYDVFVGEEVCDASSRMGVPTDDNLKKSEESALKKGVPESAVENMRGGCTGVIGVLRGKQSEKKTALRFDIDALAINENLTEKNHFYRSENKNVMHACGHDGHIAVGLGVASLLSQYQEQLENDVYLIFQPAEEGCRGAKAIVNKGWLDKIDTFYSGHIGIGCREPGQIGACTRGFMASTKIDLIFHGVAAHAANAPEEGRNALLAAAEFTVKAYDFYQTCSENVRMNVGRMKAGSGRNIIADEAVLEVETRGEDTASNQLLKEELCRLAEMTSKKQDVTCEIRVVGDVNTGKSDDELVKCGYEVAKSMGIGDMYDVDAAFTASEDVVTMMNHVQKHGGHAAYFMFGTRLFAEHHHPEFDFDEDVLPVMVEFYAKLLLKNTKDHTISEKNDV